MGYNMKGFSGFGNSPMKKKIWPPGKGPDSNYAETLEARLSPDNREHKGKSAQTFENIKNDHDVDDNGIPQTDPEGYWKKAAKHGITPKSK